MPPVRIGCPLAPAMTSRGSRARHPQQEDWWETYGDLGDGGRPAGPLATDLTDPVRPRPGIPVPVEGTVPGRAYQLGEILPGGHGGGRVLWVPMLDGADRAGVLRIGLGPGVVDEEPLRRRCWALSGLLGHILISKVPYSERKPFVALMCVPAPLCTVLGSGSGWQRYGTGMRG